MNATSRWALWLLASTWACQAGAPGHEQTPNNGGTQDTTPPQPELLNLVALAENEQVTLSWLEPSAPELEDVLVRWAPDGREATRVAPGEQRFTATGLANDTTYIFTVIGVFADGSETLPARVASAPRDIVGPESVRDLAAAPGSKAVRLAWVDPQSADLAHIEIAWTPGDTPPVHIAPGAQAHTVTGLQNYTEYAFSVRAVDTAGNASQVFTTNATPVDQPTPPALVVEDDSGISGTDGLTNLSTDLTFAGAGVGAGRRVELYADDRQLGSTQATEDGTWTYTFAGELEDGTYALTARALDASDAILAVSEPRPLTIDTTGPAAPPRLLSPAVGANTGINLRPRFRWEEAAADDGRVQLQAATDPDFTDVVYDWRGLKGGAFRPELPLAVSNQVPVGTRYYLRLRAVDAAGNAGSWSDSSADPPHRYVNAGRFNSDFNGDGYADVVVGAPELNRVYVYLGNATERFPDRVAPSSLNADLVLSDGVGADTDFGVVVESAGDVNGDGFADIVAGAQEEAYLFLGRGQFPFGTGLTAASADLALSVAERSSFAGQIEGVGDVNADGYDDVVIAAPESGNGETYLYLGSAAPDAESDVQLPMSYVDVVQRGLDINSYDEYQTVAPTGGLAGAEFGHAVAGVGDLDRDGFADYVVGAPNDEKDGKRGSFYVFWGEAEPQQALGTVVVLGSFNGEQVRPAGDFNGDGQPDFIVTGFPANNVLLYTADTDKSLRRIFQFGDIISGTMAGAGDLNGDGFDDIVTSNPGWNDDGLVRGYFGASSPNASKNFQIRGNQQFGRSLCIIGDVNGDGLDDLAIGEPWFLGGQAYVFSGARLSGLSGGGQVPLADAALRVVKGEQNWGEVGYSVGAEAEPID